MVALYNAMEMLNMGLIAVMVFLMGIAHTYNKETFSSGQFYYKTHYLTINYVTTFWDNATGHRFYNKLTFLLLSLSIALNHYFQLKFWKFINIIMGLTPAVQCFLNLRLLS